MTSRTTKTIDDLAAGQTDERIQAGIDVLVIARAIVELRDAVEEYRRDAARNLTAYKTEVARCKETAEAAQRRVDAFAEKWAEHRGEMDTATRSAGEQLKLASRTARDINEKLKAFEELRDATPDPVELLKPVKKALGQLSDDVRTLAQNIDSRFEGIPGINRMRPLETRGEGPSAFTRGTAPKRPKPE